MLGFGRLLMTKEERENDIKKERQRGYRKISKTLKKYYKSNPNARIENSNRVKKYYQEHPEVRDYLSRKAKEQFEKFGYPSKGKKISEETKEKLRKANLGKKHRPDTIEKMSNSHKGNRCWMFGKKFTEEHRINISESHKGEKSWCYGKYGNKHPAWKGGKSFEPYDISFNRSFKELIRKKDKFQCKLCGLSQYDLNKRLFVHHIDYNKKNCDLNNFISLCDSCHSKTNGKRKFWKKYLRLTRFIEDYKCDYDLIYIGFKEIFKKVS